MCAVAVRDLRKVPELERGSLMKRRGMNSRKESVMTPTELEKSGRVFFADLEAEREASDDVGGASAAGGVFPPPTKRGGKVPKGREQQDLNEVELVLTDTGETKTVMVRKPAVGQCAFIDGMRFTIGIETWHRTEKGTLLTDEQIVLECSLMMERIFGYGITKRLSHGRDFYETCYVLGEDLGYMALGGKSQKGTMLIVVHGTGAAAARAGWEQRLHLFLSGQASRPTITRVDLAHDCYDGSYWTCEYADKAYDFGWWTNGGRCPSHEYRGNWKRPDGSGRTLYIGKRKNGKLCRTYEKGKQLGDAASPWVRVEVERHNNDCVIPLAVLLDPSAYFLGSYRALCVIDGQTGGTRIRTERQRVQITFQKCIDNIKTSYGAYLRVMRQCFPSDGEFLDAIQRNDEAWPTRLRTLDETQYGAAMHSGPGFAKPETALFGVFD